jgi:hypothetical protein
VAAMYDWAKGNAQQKSGADVAWNHDAKAGNRLFLQYPEFEDLSKSIEETSEETLTLQELAGTLVGADTKTRRFHFVTKDDRDMRGRFIDAISDSQKAHLPAKYIATMEVKTKVNYAKGEEEVSYDLIKLTPVTE